MTRFLNQRPEPGSIIAACHIHSDWSYDGKWSLQKLATEFAARGYQVLLMTEHDKGFTHSKFADYRQACVEASNSEILLVPGIEYSDADNIVHVLVWGDVPFLGEGITTLNMLQATQEADGIAVLAHPSRRNAWKLFDSAWARFLTGIELWNRKTDGWAPSRTAPLLLQMTGLQPFVGLDFHAQNQFFPLSTKLSADGVISENSVLDALRCVKATPLAFNCGLECAISGWRSYGLRSAESCRRVLRSIIRRPRIGTTTLRHP